MYRRGSGISIIGEWFLTKTKADKGQFDAVSLVERIGFDRKVLVF